MVRFWMIFEGGTARSCNREAMGVKESESPGRLQFPLGSLDEGDCS